MTLTSILAKLGIIASAGELNLRHAIKEHRITMQRASRVGTDIARGDDYDSKINRRLDAIDAAFRGKEDKE